jgi:hypothetical protein
MGGEHGLVVLLLMLRDHAEREAVGDQPLAGEPGPLDQVEHAPPDLPGIRPRLGGRQQRQGRALGSRVLERVIERVDLRVHRLPPANLPEQPQLLLIGDVGQVPHQRRHDRRVLADQVVVLQAAGQAVGALPG